MALGIKERIYRAVAIVSDPDPEEFNWRSALADAGIVAGMQFFYTLAGISAAQVISDPIKALVAALISAGLGFFTTLALKRGLKTAPITESK